MDLIKLWKILRDENTRLSDLPFLARLQTAISCTVITEAAKKQLEKLLACENANQECQRAIAPTPETRTIIDYLKACRNLGSENQEMQMLAETMAAAFRMGNEGYFTCGDKSHLKRDYAKKANKKTSKNLPSLPLLHCVKDCKSKFDIEGKPIPGNSKQGTPPGPRRQKPGANSIFSLKPSTSASAAVDIPALNDFFLYPQAVPSRVPTGLFVPRRPQNFGLLLGQSSLTFKGINVYPGIIDSDYKGEIQIMMSSLILWQFKKGDKIAQLPLLPYISINSSNYVWTGRFSSTNQKQSLWTSLVTEYARTNINIKINGKRFSDLLDTESDITIISKYLWPKSWPIQKISCQVAGISQTEVQEISQNVQIYPYEGQKGEPATFKTVGDRCTP